ncbi:MAG: ferredoxin [Planctomycetota bacterium]
MPHIVKVTVDQEVCLAHGFCVDSCPKVFKLADDAYAAIVRPDAEQHFVNEDAAIREAANTCPVDCIEIDEQATPNMNFRSSYPAE